MKRFEFKEITPVTEKDVEVVVNGLVIGHIKKSVHIANTSFHAVLDSGLYAPHCTGLIQGHGDTREAALLDAFRKTRLQTIKFLQAVENLEIEIYGVNEIVSEAEFTLAHRENAAYSKGFTDAEKGEDVRFYYDDPCCSSSISEAYDEGVKAWHRKNGVAA